MKVPKRILLVRPDRLGDLILSLPTAEVLKTEIPGVEVFYMSSRYASEISAMVDYVDGWMIDDGNDGRRSSLFGLVGNIERGGFDCLIELKPSWRTAAAGFLARVPVRIGTSRRAYSLFYNRRVNVPRKSSGSHQTDLELAHLKPLGIDGTGLNPRLKATSGGLARAASLVGSKYKSYIVMHPGSGGSSPNWPRENYVSLAASIAANTGFKVVITNHDKNIGEFENCLNLGGRTDLETLAGVLHGAKLFVSGSTGPLHLADALGTPCISFFPNREDIGAVRWGPRRNMSGVLTPSQLCRCGGPGSCRCLERISAAEAFNKISGVLKAAKSPSVGS